jgi:hypothetical protein
VLIFRVIDAGISKKILDDNMRNESFQKIFKVFGEELVQGEKFWEHFQVENFQSLCVRCGKKMGT